MSAFSGPQGKGASRRRREQKRVEAEARNELTPPERRRAHRRQIADGAHIAVRALAGIKAATR